VICVFCAAVVVFLCCAAIIVVICVSYVEIAVTCACCVVIVVVAMLELRSLLSLTLSVLFLLGLSCCRVSQPTFEAMSEETRTLGECAVGFTRREFNGR
jgi:hypothetical protein